MLYAVELYTETVRERGIAREDTPTFRNTSIMFLSPSTLTFMDNGMERIVSFVEPDVEYSY